METSTPHIIVEDASRFTHGAIYHALFDRPLAEARKQVISLIPEKSTVLDIACGTGELCFELATQKNCQIVGIDLSHRMIEFARKRNRYPNVHFFHHDGTTLTDIKPDTFDYATILFLLHEVSRDIQVEVLNEALCKARKVIVIDSKVPLPLNLHGIALRIVEASGGRVHYSSFADYLAAGGINGILSDKRVRASALHSSIFWYGCREMVVLNGEAETRV
jgi:SAM-dependent methyltransferase